MDWLVGGNHHEGRQIPPQAVFVVVGVLGVVGGVVGVAVAVSIAIAIVVVAVIART